MFIDELQYKVQELVDRKKTSSYYTTPDGLAVIRQLVKEVDRREGIVLMDPFMGSYCTPHYYQVLCRRPFVLKASGWVYL